MTYNIKGYGAFFSRWHIDRVARVIADVKPDIVGLQEVHRHTLLSRKRDQAAELERGTGMRLFFGPSFGDARRDYGNAVLTRGEVIEAHVEPLPGTGEPRSLLVSTIAIDGLRLHVYVTHLASGGRFRKRTRLLQSQAVHQIAAGSELPFVLTGDFNSHPRSDELRVLYKGGFAMSCFGGDGITHRATRSCLDYIFIDRGWEIRNTTILKVGPSDHWPLVAELHRL